MDDLKMKTTYGDWQHVGDIPPGMASGVGCLEEAIRAQTHRFSRLVDTIPQFVWTASPDGRLVYCNSAWQQRVGACRGAPVEAVMSALLHPEDRARWLAVWHGALESGKPYEIEYRMQSRTEGEPKWYLERGVPGSSEERLERWFITATLLEEQKRREEGMQSLLRRKEQYFVSVLHELRNPLAPIANAVELLGKRGEDPSSVALAQGIIRRQLQQLTRLVEDLLDLSRIANGTLALRYDTVNAEEIIASAVEAARPHLELRGHELATSLPRKPLWLRGDAMRLVQVITNLLVNAAKFTPPGGRISVAAEQVHSSAVVRVKDNGIGMEPEVLPHIFDLFTQATPGSRQTPEGLGVGLAVVRQLVELHGGCVSAHSDGIGRGSEFIVRLPLSPDERGDTGPESSTV